MNKHKILFLTIFSFLFLNFSAYSYPFNDKLSQDEVEKISSGEVLIRNINYSRNISLNNGVSTLGDKLLKEMHDFSPKYLAEVIQIKPYEGNEDLPQKLEEILNNVPDYAGIPYFSERTQQWYNLYDSATITNTSTKDDMNIINADLLMEPFGTVGEYIEISKDSESILYSAINTNKLRYYDKFDCVGPHKMKICILLFRDGDNWILYGIGGVNAPRIPFFTERIQTSFINRINTFCSYIFKKF